MKRITGWNAYVAEAGDREDRAIEVPISDDEIYIVDYPTRSQGKEIAAAQRTGDIDALLIALLGEEAGGRVAELSANEPGFILDGYLLEIMKAFGFVDEDIEAATDLVKAAGKSRSSNATRKRGTQRKTSPAA